MYEAFYNLTEKPFTLLPDPGFLYLSDKHQMALTLLDYGLHDHAGFTVISGLAHKEEVVARGRAIAEDEFVTAVPGQVPRNQAIVAPAAGKADLRAQVLRYENGEAAVIVTQAQGDLVVVTDRAGTGAPPGA